MRIANRPTAERQTVLDLSLGDCFEQADIPAPSIIWMRTWSNDGICAVALTGDKPGSFWSGIPSVTEVVKRDCELVVKP